MKRTIIFLLICLLSIATTWGQDGSGSSKTMTVSGTVVYVNEKGVVQDNSTDVWYVVLPTSKAQEAAQKFRQAFGSLKDLDLINKFQSLLEEYNIQDKTMDLYFKDNALPNMSFLFVSEEEGKVVIMPVVTGKTDYRGEVKITMNAIQNVNVTGHQKEVDICEVEAEDADDGTVTFNIIIDLMKGYSRDDARLVIKPSAMDCQTNDLMAYLAPIVGEGSEYHLLQNKRMAFNYTDNDPLAKYYDESINIRNEKRIVVKKSIKWKKPDSLRNHVFDAPYTIFMEDYHHVYVDSTVECSCLNFRPFKFLDLTGALTDLPLIQEFYDRPRNQVEDKSVNLDLQFVKGTATLVDDSLNNKKFSQLAEQLGSAGTIISLTIKGAASPDGSLARNEALARERSEKARQILAQRVSTRPEVGRPVVHTWGDVIEELHQSAKDSIAKLVQNMIDQGGDPTQRIASLSCYNHDIEPILAGMRVMTCDYQFQRQKIFTPEECRDAYYTYKQDYINRTRSFSNGDFYNLYRIINDSLELDTITMIAYNEIKSEPKYWEYNKIAPYVFNRMSVMMMRKGKPNPELLKPFIDFRRRGQKKNRPLPTSIDYEIRPRGLFTTHFNRREIMINQAVCYQMDSKPDTAKFLLDWLIGAGKDDASVRRLEKFINLRHLHPRRKTLRGEEKQKYEEAKEMAISISDENKAILFTEIADWGKRDEAMLWVNKMSDDNPKKWYLKGVLWAQKAENEPAVKNSHAASAKANDGKFYRWSEEKKGEMFGTPELEEYNKRFMEWQQEHPGEEAPLEEEAAPKQSAKENLSEEQLKRLQKIPRFIAYFYHCFKLDPSYVDYYRADRNVGAQIRKKFKYNYKDKALYEEKFNQICKEDDSSAFKEDTSKEDSEKNSEEHKEPTTVTPTEHS